MQHEWVFYDGACGFCHRWIRFVLAMDKHGKAFRFAPRAAETFRDSIPEHARESLPASIVVLTRYGVVLTRSKAILHILKQLGWVCRVVAFAAGVIPSRVLNLVYAVIARVRHRLLPTPQGRCPVVSPDLVKRVAP